MEKTKGNIGFSKKHIEEGEAIDRALKEVSRKLIAEEKARDGYLVISDKDGNVIKVPAKDL